VEGALRMQTLVQDLLTLSRVGRNGIIPKAVDCNAVVREVQQNLAVVIQETGAVIKHGALPSVRSDHLHMVQLFQNLLGNALKFRSHRPPVISVSAQLRGPQWEFAVADNGLGIAAQHREAIFVVFQRLHTRAEYPGNGVGLAICKKIVEQHGGRIWAEPAPGEGAALRFTLPAVAADEENGHAGNSAC
jgi:light-regulated signal transduction histidine kinase (bacteriophytochrome)